MSVTGAMNSDVVGPKGGLAQAIRADIRDRVGGGQAGVGKLVSVLKGCDGLRTHGQAGRSLR